LLVWGILFDSNTKGYPMAAYQVRYWFETSSRDKSGEQLTEIIEADNPQAVGKRVEEFMARDTFTITPSFGPAASGYVVVNSAHVRYVEVIPAQTTVTPTAFVTSQPLP
jgi:hypothetical protein